MDTTTYYRNPHPGLCDGGCASVGKNIYCFGGYDGSSHFNDLHNLNLETFQWTKIHSRNDQTNWPIPKSGCGLVSIDETTLCCFGGYGIDPPQPGSLPGRKKWTREFHLFNLQKGLWSSPLLKEQILCPPCSEFSFTKVDQDRVVLFGGYQPGRGCVNDLYLFNLRNMEVTKVEPLPGVPQPIGRWYHAACCLNYDDDHPKVLISGGVDKDSNVLGDMWILDVYSGKWTEVTPPEFVKRRYRHSITASKLEPELTKVLVFGGKLKWPKGSPIAETATLEFDLRILTHPKKSRFFTEISQTRFNTVKFNQTPGVASQPAVLTGQETTIFKHHEWWGFCKRFDLSDEDIDKEVSAEHILEIYLQLEKWKQVATHLGLTQADVQAIEGRARPDEELMRLYMLQEWRGKERLSGTATYQVLLKALIRVCSPSVLTTVVDMCKAQGAASQYPSSSTPTKRDQHSKAQLVKLCKRFELSSDNIDKEVSDDHILEIYHQLEKWKQVAAHLGLTQADVQAIESGARPDEELMRLNMLQKWKKVRRLDGAATYQVLFNALIKCKCSESAIQVCELLSSDDF